MRDALMIAVLETLHSPSQRGGYWDRAVCNGCDADGWEAEAPEWPCQTAAILWPDPDEQAALLAEWHEWADAQAAAVKAKLGDSPLSFIPPIWEEQVMNALRATRSYMRPGENHDGP